MKPTRFFMPLLFAVVISSCSEDQPHSPPPISTLVSQADSRTFTAELSCKSARFPIKRPVIVREAGHFGLGGAPIILFPPISDPITLTVELPLPSRISASAQVRTQGEAAVTALDLKHLDFPVAVGRVDRGSAEKPPTLQLTLSRLNLLLSGADPTKISVKLTFFSEEQEPVFLGDLSFELESKPLYAHLSWKKEEAPFQTDTRSLLLQPEGNDAFHYAASEEIAIPPPAPKIFSLGSRVPSRDGF